MSSTEKWDKRFLQICREISTWSKDPSTKCGSIIVRPDRTIASLGYNGFPRGMEDRTEWYNDRPEKYDRIVHSDMNAILSAKEPLKGYTMYGFPGMPCSRCAAHIIQAGISRVVGGSYVNNRLHSRFSSLDYFQEAGVEVKTYVLPHH